MCATESLDSYSVEYDDYDEACEQMREKNQAYLDLFEQDMRGQGLSERTINQHLDNVEFFINVYLTYYGVHEMPFGCHDISGFLGDWFIRKCMWSTPGTIKTNATSIKKFYKCMLANGHIEQADYDELVSTIKSEMAEWQEECAAFNDPSNDPFNDMYDVDGLGLGSPFDGPSGISAPGENPLFDAIYKAVAKELGLDGMLKDYIDKINEANGFEGESNRDSDDADDDSSKTTSGTPDLNENEPLEPPTLKEIVESFTLMLFYLTSWEERVGGKNGISYRRAWKSADWDALDALRETGLISCTNKAKSVTITEDGMLVAEHILRELGLEHLFVR